jgi:hypothetical protein
LQVSAGHLREAEADVSPLPRSDVTRATASATYHRLNGNSAWATTFAYGVNSGREPAVAGTVDLTTHALLLESNLSLGDRHTWFARVESVGKAGHDLHIHEAPVTVFTVGKAQLGYVRYFAEWRGLTTGVGGTASLSLVPTALAPRYSGRATPGFGVFVMLRPSPHQM